MFEDDLLILIGDKGDVNLLVDDGGHKVGNSFEFFVCNLAILHNEVHGGGKLHGVRLPRLRQTSGIVVINHADNDGGAQFGKGALPPGQF